LKEYHATYCKKECSTNERHDNIRDFIYQIAQQGCLAARKEEPALFEGQERPADIIISNFKDGKDYLLDVGITCPTRSDIAKNASLISNFTAEKYAKVKRDKVAAKLAHTNYVFAPIIAETFESGTDSSVTLINEIGTYYAARHKISISEEYGRKLQYYFKKQTLIPSRCEYHLITYKE
jgi:hypothetical protein